MSSKTFNERKLSKLFVGMLFFFIMGMFVEAATCTSIKSKTNCQGKTAGGYNCIWRQNACYNGTKITSKKTTKKTTTTTRKITTSYCRSIKDHSKCTSSGCIWRQGACYAGLSSSNTTTTRKVTTSFSTCGTTNKAWGSISECTGRGYTYDSTNKCCNTSSKKNGNTCGQSNYGTWTKSSCNAKVVSGKCHLWNNNNGCCNITSGSCSVFGGSSGGTSGGSSGGSSPTVITYKVLFDQNYGYGLACDAGFSVPTAGVCQKTGIAGGTKVNFPASSSSMYRDGQGQLIGWTKTVSNGAPNCNSNVIVKDSSFTVSANTDFYACYREDIGGYRYLQKDYVADGGSVDFTCGQQIWIEYCTKESGTDYCYYYENSTGKYRKIYRMKLASTYEGAACSADNTATATPEDVGYRYVKLNGQNYSCGDQLYITTCTSDACNYTKIKKSSGEISENGTIDKDYLDDNQSDAKKACDKLEDNKCSNTSMKSMRKASSYTICYDKDATNAEVKELLEEYYKCDTKNGYYFDRTAVSAESKESCNSKGICTRTYRVSCTKGNSAKPTLSVTSGIVQSNGYGTIRVTATAKEGVIDSYFTSDYYLTPTDSNTWVPINGNSFTIESSPGVKYIWVRDSKGNISNAVSGAVIDTTNTNTTINKLQLYDANGNVQNPVSSGTAYKVADVKNNNYVRLSNDLSKDSKVVADAFNPYDMEYKLEVDSPTVSVYATLTSTDSKYVDGFEPRTVNLNYGINTVLIKIQNKEGITRTYTILVTRTDSRTSDNTLSDIILNVGDINFNANVTDYKIEVPKSTTSVDVQATIASNKASYVSGYEPDIIDINGDTTVKLIKVKSETGSTRTYVLTFVKEGTDTITKESLQIEDLVIPGVYMPFEEDIANYSLSVGYETDTIDINSVLKDEDSIASISIKKKSDTEYKVVSNKGIGLDVGENFIEIRVIDKENEESYYRLTIIRKEFGLEVSNDTTLKDLRVLNYEKAIDFDPNKKEYTVKIKQEKSLVITAVPNNNRAEVFIRGNDELTGFSTVRVKVVAENGEYETYSIDIKKDAFNKTIEIASIVAGVVIILVSSGIIIVKKKSKANREYFEE